MPHNSGGNKISRHGRIMHCKYCTEPGHNRSGCKYLKAGVPPPSSAGVPPPNPPGNVPPPNPPNPPENVPPPNPPVYEDLLVDNLVQQLCFMSYSSFRSLYIFLDHNLV